MITHWTNGEMNGYYKAKNKEGIHEGEFRFGKHQGLCANYSPENGKYAFGLYCAGSKEGLWFEKAGHGKPF